MGEERVGNAQRTEVIGLLGRALDDGALGLADHDGRIVAVGTATTTTDLLLQVWDLPPEYRWQPPPPPAPDRAPGQLALVLGIVSVPLAFCLVGIVPGVIAVVLSRRGPPPPGLSPALAGRVLGILGILMSAAAGLAAILLTMQPG
jgi:hypothetical protein